MKTNKAPMDKLPASFRDPAGFIFTDTKGGVFRKITDVGADNFELATSSGLYKELFDKGLLVKHNIEKTSKEKNIHAVIQPEKVPFISYPFEWSFSQLQDAAILTLASQKKALARDMALKDASAYNVQFLNGKPVLIDTLSFEKYEQGSPWQAYRQFCQHFLAPLALMAHTDLNLSQLMRVHIDGIPLDLASKLLPVSARFKPGIAMHIVLHAKAQKKKASTHVRQTAQISKQSLEGVLLSLERTVKSLKPLKYDTEWGDYYSNTNYTADASDEKARLIRKFVKPLEASSAVDMGGNNGHFSRVLNKAGLNTVCTDIDPNAVEANYRYTKEHKEKVMLPLLVDLSNPGGNLGWENQERSPIHERLQTDLVMALAIIHHLAISNNLPLENVAHYFARFAPYLIIEFVPKKDSQVEKLLSTREDIFPNYNEGGFIKAFGQYFTLEKEEPIKGTARTLYLFKRRS